VRIGESSEGAQVTGACAALSKYWGWCPTPIPSKNWYRRCYSILRVRAAAKAGMRLLCEIFDYFGNDYENNKPKCVNKKKSCFQPPLLHKANAIAYSLRLRCSRRCVQRCLRPRARLVRLLQPRVKSGQRTATARRLLAVVAHACHAIGAGCGWLRRLANAPLEARHARTPPECLFDYRGALNVLPPYQTKPSAGAGYPQSRARPAAT